MALVAAAAVSRSPAAFADNPIVQTSYTADPAPMVYDGTLYLYTSHDEDVTVNNFFTMNDWRLYSTVDMANWTDLGSPASYKTFSWGTGDAWAPQGVPRNGKFYLYTPINNSTGSKIGVLVADNPAGPFTDPLGKALVSTGTGDIDPTVYIDDDGQAYMYWGNPNLWYVKLNSDMTSYSGSPTKTNLTTAGFGTRSNTDRATAYEEGPWFYKRNSLYYIVYPADGTPEKISYTTSSGPLGPWTYGGDIMAKESGAGSSFTNHPGVIDYKGKSYFFYHDGALPGGGDYKRSVCVEEFTYNADGSIPTIKMSTAGPTPLQTLDPFSQVEAETIAFSSGLKTETCTDTGGGMDVTSISAGDYIKVKNVDFQGGVTAFDARVSASASGAAIELHLDSQTGTLLGTCDVSGASSWTTKTCTVSGGIGTHDLFMKFVGGSGDLFKFNWWKFTGLTTSNPAGGAGGIGGLGGASGAGGANLGASGASSLAGTGGTAGSSMGAAGHSGGNAGSGGTGIAGATGGALAGETGSAGITASGGQANGGSGATPGGTGGATSAGGAPSAGAGAGHAGRAAPDDASVPKPSNSAGCGCRASSGADHASPVAALLLLGLGLRRRRSR
jgi:MYXO-CTERM domain-containing protein